MKVLISSQSFGKANPRAFEILKDAGLELCTNPYGRKLNENELLELAEGIVGIIAGTENITEKVISKSNLLRVISRYGVGVDNVDLKAADKRGILVYNTPETPALAVAELTLSLILNLLRRICKVDRGIRSNVWQPEMGNLLTGKTVGILGLGRIGKKLVQLLKPFAVKLLAHEPYPDHNFVILHDITLTPLNRLIQESDIITLHLPLNEQTYHILGEDEISQMKKNAILVNTARGGLIEEKALIHVIEQQLIGGAALDTFEVEPYQGRLKEFDNIILMPHIGTYTVETRKKMDLEAAENLIKGLKEVDFL